MRETQTLKAFCKGDNTARNILAKHYDGVEPSRIDIDLGLVPGEAHMTIVDFWMFDKAKKSR